jgi:hypothetical protein
MSLRPVLLLAVLAAPPGAADVPIHDLQGAGAGSPYAGQAVVTNGIVTFRRLNGFFLQAPDAEADSDPATSEGLFVLTSTIPPAAALVGNRVRVAGTVLEVRPSADPASPPMTAISGEPQVTLLSTANALPSPVVLAPADLSPGAEAGFLERYEGMRVRAEPLLVVAPTGGTVDVATATARSDGVLFGVLPGTPRPFREEGADVGIPLPAGSPCCVPRFDGNPERLRVDTDALPGSLPVDSAAGSILTGLVGPLDFASRAYTLLPESAPSVAGTTAARAVPVAAAGELTVGFLNLENFFDAVPSAAGPTLTSSAYRARLKRASLAIRTLLRTPDVLAVAEVENLSTLQALASWIGADALAAGEAFPGYRAFLEEGNDPGGIDVGFLVAARVGVVSVSQEGKAETYVDPVTGSPALLHDRPPLVLAARAAASSDGTDLPFTVVVSHLRSLIGVAEDSSTGLRVRAKRQAQAESLATLLARLQSERPDVPLLAVGDFNAFEFSDGLVDVLGTIRGAPAPAERVVVNRSIDLVEPDLVDLGVVDALLPPPERYSYVFEGSAELLDHALASRATAARVTGLAMARVGADFPEAWRGDPSRVERLTDHDGLVVRLRLDAGTGRSPAIPQRDTDLPVPVRTPGP